MDQNTAQQNIPVTGTGSSISKVPVEPVAITPASGVSQGDSQVPVEDTTPAVTPSGDSLSDVPAETPTLQQSDQLEELPKTKQPTDLEIPVPVSPPNQIDPQDIADDAGELLIQEVDDKGNISPLSEPSPALTEPIDVSAPHASQSGMIESNPKVEEEKVEDALGDSQVSEATNASDFGGGSMGVGSLLDILKTKGLLSEGQYEEVKVESAKTGKRAEEIVTEKGLVSEESFAQARAEYLNVPFKKLGEVAVSPEALAVLPEAVARRYQTLPFLVDKQNNTLSVAMVNPLDLKAIDFVEKKTGMRVIPHLVTDSDMSMAFSEQYARSLSGEVTQALADSQETVKRTIDVTQLGQVIREAPIAKIVETLLTFALRSRASDIHIEPQETRTRVRYRIDGILQEKLVLPLKVHDALVSRIKILARLKIDERRMPQDGRFNFTANNEEVDLRVSTLPTVHGEKVVMRLLKKTTIVPTLQDLGLRGRALKNFQEAITVPHGIVLITGPTGSGKTTTLYAILSKINTPKVNIVTLEDPVEYEIPGVNQVQINTKAGLTFASGLRSFLRQDPNVIMVGEVRDSETADLAIQASLTGHLVFSTLHTNSSAGALPRLLDMDAEPFLLASSMTSVVAQRVARKICEHCKEEFAPEKEVIDDIKEVLGSLYDGFLRQKGEGERKVTMFRGKGCSECGDTGYSGRIGIFEVMIISEPVAKLILERAPASSIEKQALTEGMILMKQDGYLKALEGITSLEEVLRVAEV